MNVTILREFPASELEGQWRDYLTRLECPSHYDAPEFLAEPLWVDRPPFAIIAIENKRVVGVLTGLRVGNQLMCGLPSRPQISVDPREDSAAVLETLAQGLMQEQGAAELISVYSWRGLELGAFARHGFQGVELPGNVVLDLTLGAEALFKQFTKDRRRNIRYAEKNGVEVTEAVSASDIRDAYEVYLTWRERKKETVKGKTLSFELYEKTMTMRENRRFFIARLQGKIIATNVFRFFPGGLFESSANTSLDEYIHLKPNDLLQWKGIEWACNHGLRRHSLGGSHQFLLRFGGTVVPILRYRRDCTWLHHHDLREKVESAGRRIVGKLPPSVEQGIRTLAGKKKAKAPGA